MGVEGGRGVPGAPGGASSEADAGEEDAGAATASSEAAAAVGMGVPGRAREGARAPPSAGGRVARARGRARTSAAAGAQRPDIARGAAWRGAG